jgi:hypothetical protein
MSGPCVLKACKCFVRKCETVFKSLGSELKAEKLCVTLKCAQKKKNFKSSNNLYNKPIELDLH